MNLGVIYYKVKERLKLLRYDFIFKVFQKQLWKFSYNKDGNKFSCGGKLRNCKVLITGTNNELIIEDRVSLINVRIEVRGNNNKVRISEGCIFREGGRIKVEDEGNMLYLGPNSDFVDVFFALSERNTKVIVEEDVMMSAKVVVRNSDVHSIVDKDLQRINDGQDVIIRKKVWVGYGATILKGTEIGENSIIGTQTVVAGKKIPNGSVVAGNPGKIVKERVSWIRERIHTQ